MEVLSRKRPVGESRPVLLISDVLLCFYGGQQGQKPSRWSLAIADRRSFPQARVRGGGGGRE